MMVLNCLVQMEIDFLLPSRILSDIICKPAASMSNLYSTSPRNNMRTVRPKVDKNGPNQNQHHPGDPRQGRNQQQPVQPTQPIPINQPREDYFKNQRSQPPMMYGSQNQNELNRPSIYYDNYEDTNVGLGINKESKTSDWNIAPSGNILTTKDLKTQTNYNPVPNLGATSMRPTFTDKSDSDNTGAVGKFFGLAWSIWLFIGIGVLISILLVVYIFYKCKARKKKKSAKRNNRESQKQLTRSPTIATINTNVNSTCSSKSDLSSQVTNDKDNLPSSVQQTRVIPGIALVKPEKNLAALVFASEGGITSKGKIDVTKSLKPTFHQEHETAMPNTFPTQFSVKNCVQSQENSVDHVPSISSCTLSKKEPISRGRIEVTAPSSVMTSSSVSSVAPSQSVSQVGCSDTISNNSVGIPVLPMKSKKQPLTGPNNVSGLDTLTRAVCKSIELPEKTTKSSCASTVITDMSSVCGQKLSQKNRTNTMRSSRAMYNQSQNQTMIKESFKGVQQIQNGIVNNASSANKIAQEVSVNNQKGPGPIKQHQFKPAVLDNCYNDIPVLLPLSDKNKNLIPEETRTGMVFEKETFPVYKKADPNLVMYEDTTVPTMRLES